MKVEYKIKPRVKLYFFGIFSRVLYDLVKETDSGEYQGNKNMMWNHERITTRKVIWTYSDLESAEKGLKKGESKTNWM